MNKKKKSVSREIYDQILKKITSQVWKPGDKIPTEKTLMEIYGMSRISIREAIKQLVSLGLLETRQGSGTYVREYNTDMITVPITSLFCGKKFTKKDVLDILEVRRIEIMIVGLAAKNVNAEGVSELRRIHGEMVKGADDAAVHIKTDYEFHLQICKMTNNLILLQICKVMYEALQQAMLLISEVMGSSRAIYYHSRLLDTIEHGYVHEAEATMEDHLNDTVEAIRSIPESSELFSNF